MANSITDAIDNHAQMTNAENDNSDPADRDIPEAQPASPLINGGK